MALLSAFKVYLSLILSLAYVCFVSAQGRIVNGQPIKIANAKFAVSVHSLGTFICGGVIVKPTAVITAAHCVKEESASNLLVRGGSANRNAGGVTSKVTKMIHHPNYNASTFANDISVLKLANAINGINRLPIAIAQLSAPVGDSLKVVGWGQMSETNTERPIMLLAAGMKQMGKSACEASYNLTLPRASRCLISASFTCPGDSGSGLIHKGYVMGVVSGGAECSSTTYPNIYTSVVATKIFLDASLKA